MQFNNKVMDCQHKTHPNIIKRLKKAYGQLNGIIKMLEKDNHQCNQIAQQMQAVYKAVGNAKSILVQDHIQGCVENIIKNEKVNIDEKMQELKDIAKYLS